MPPTYLGSCSMTQTGAPCLTSSYAAVRPAGPAPRMTTGSLMPNARKTPLRARITHSRNDCHELRKPSIHRGDGLSRDCAPKAVRELQRGRQHNYETALGT